MTNEAILYFETGPPIPFTVAENAGIEKGALLKLTDPITAAASAGAEDNVAGIAASEKIADDGKTKLAVYRQGVFIVTASGSVTEGDTVALKGSANLTIVATATAVGGETLGIALGAATEGQTYLMELRPGANNQAY